MLEPNHAMATLPISIFVVVYPSAPFPFAATFVAQAAVAALSAFVLLGVRLSAPPSSGTSGGRPLGAIVRQPRFVTAVVCAVVSYLLINFLMTSAPLAMRMCGLFHSRWPYSR